MADDFALRLDTALLFDDVRALATAEERHRIAREMHDGVAQEIVALGYVVDEIESVTPEADPRAGRSPARRDQPRRHRAALLHLRPAPRGRDARLSGALADYAREVATAPDLRVHLMLDESGSPLSARTQTEFLRVAQEAIGNVRRHAHAANLWVTLVADGTVHAPRGRGRRGRQRRPARAALRTAHHARARRAHRRDLASSPGQGRHRRQPASRRQTVPTEGEAAP